MGRDLNWYVLRRNIEHDVAKKFCFTYEFQPDSHDVLKDIQHALGNTCASYQYICDFVNTGEYTDEWCPKCHMFADGIDQDSPIVVAHYHMGHSYSNPTWMSDWNIRNLLIGSYHTQCAELFRKDMMYMEIRDKDVQDARMQIERKNEPLRRSDKESKEETVMILDALAKWTIQPDEYVVIMRDEC